MKFQIFFVIILSTSILFVGVFRVCLAKGYRAKFKRMECHAEPEWGTNITCEIKAKSRHVKIVNMHVDLVQPLTLLYGEGTLYKRLNGWRPWIVRGNGSVCDALAGKFHPIMKIFKNMLNKYTNVNHSCPLTKALIAKDLQLDILDMGLSIFPEGVYKWDLLLYEPNRTFIGYIRSFFEVNESNS